VVQSSAIPKELDLKAINQQLEQAEAVDLVKWASWTFPQGLVMSTSFGIQAAVMLHLVTSILPNIPVIWVDTGYLHPETYSFAEELTERLDLNLHVYQSPLSPARMEALYGPLWEVGSVETTVGDWHSSRPLMDHDNSDRDTRFQGLKQECGLHLPQTLGEAESLDSSSL